MLITVFLFKTFEDASPVFLFESSFVLAFLAPELIILQNYITTLKMNFF